MAEGAYETFAQGGSMHNFVVENHYLNGRDEAFGARFLHLPTGFTLDLFEIQSVPQGFLWVNSPPESDMGEPHTCEHLLLGKGNKGRYVASLEDMSLGRSTAYTSQLYTAYPFSSQGGNDIFYDLFKAKLDAMMYPNFSDEEISREVCHVGVTVDNETGELTLDEKGTVYTEMVSTFEKHWYWLYGGMDKMLYGEDHYLSNNSGGTPPALREMKPSDLWKFQKSSYRLNNMGMIATLPDNMPPLEFMKRADGILSELYQEGQPSERVKLVIPSYNSSATPGEIKLTHYPGSNEQEPGNLVYAWPPQLDYDNNERMLLDIFLYCLGGSQTSNLYNAFINSDTRLIDLGASGVWTSVEENPGHAIWVGLSDVAVEHLNKRKMVSVAAMIQDEIKTIAAYGPGSPELEEFNNRARSRLAEMKKDYEDYLNSPPGFGLRGGGGGAWYSLIKILEKKPGFRKSVLQNEEMNFVQKLLAENTNIWTDYIAQWRLLDTKPYGIGCSADPTMLTSAVDNKNKRMAAFAEELKTKYSVTEEADAIARYKEDFDRTTDELDAIAAKIEMPEFLENPPMSFDPQLDFKLDTLAETVPMVASTFNSMTTSTIGLALNLRVVPEDKLIYVPFLSQLIRQIGVVKDGERIDYADLSRRLKNEILSLRCSISTNPTTGRVELLITAAGSNVDESREAIEWLKAGLFSPLLDEANLPRLRDVVDSRLARLRNRMKGSEEGWVNGPANGYKHQTDKLLLAGYCFLTQDHFMHRLKWRLTDAGGEQTVREVGVLFDLLANAGREQVRDDLLEFASSFGTGDPTRFESGAYQDFVSAYTLVSVESQDLISEALTDLSAILPDAPEANASEDWVYLLGQMKNDLLFRPEKVLSDLETILGLLRNKQAARMYMVSNAVDRGELWNSISDLVATLGDKELALAVYDDAPVILNRARSRYAEIGDPTYVGLINTNTRNGVFIYSAACADINDTDREKLLDFLAARLYGGGGAHSMFMKTWSAGLAYSNGLRYSETGGTVIYYAERCPDLSTTMRFVVSELQKAPHDPKLADYAVAQAFSRNRGSNSYTRRAASMASDLADGYSPEVVGNFRRNVINMRSEAGFYDLLHQRMPRVYGSVLIGYGGVLSESAGGNFFIIGPEAQFEKVEDMITATEGTQPVYRLYGRDFWITN
ncbi:MAG: hypothetical protein GY841_03415 [FCB group bacterium]|nr:hypothetical protein [FCB group bacterium]